MRWLAGLVFSATMWAGPILTLNPVNGTISGAPGATVGWGFTLSNTTDFLVPSQIAFCEGAFNPSCLDTYGTFTDFAAQFQTNSVGATVVETFNNATHNGIGSFKINSNAPPGAQDIGTIYLIYDLFSCDITNPSCNPTQTGFSQSISAPAEVDVAGAAVPEPASLSLLILGTLGLALRFGRSRSSGF
jgi:hypothetical protein